MRTSSSRLPAAGTPRPPRRTAVLAAAGAVLLSLAAAACGTDDGGTASAPTSDGNSATASASSGSPGTAAPGTTAPGGGDDGSDSAPPATRSSAPPATSTAKGQAVSSRCTVTDLKMTLGRGDPGAGNIYFPLDFTNTSGHACTLDGFPGVSLLRGDGSVIGKPADRQKVTANAVRVAPGETVEADLHTVNQGIKDGGCWRKPTLIMVYPPGSKQSMTLATSNPVVCGDTFDVGPVH